MAERLTLPVLPLREVVLFPGVTAPIGAGRPATLRAIEAALASPERLVFAVSQRQNVESVTSDALYTIGTIARIGQLQRGLSGMQLLLHGEKRGIAIHYSEKDGYLQSVVREAEEMLPISPEDPAFVALHREARVRAAELGQKSGLPDEVVQQVLAGVNEAGKFADLVAGYIDITPAQRQMLLETLSVEERLRRVLVHMQRQIGVLDAQEDIKSQVQEELGERQREMFLREQMKTIQRELGEGDERDDLEELKETLAALDLPPEARKEVDREFGRLSRIGRESMESQVIRTFLENIAELPWNERSKEHLELPAAQRILDEDHYALGDVKDRVLEFLAVRQLRLQMESREPAADSGGDGAGTLEEAKAGHKAEEVAAGESTDVPQATATVPAPNAPPKGNEDDRIAKGPILLFVGPPGVGKTSVAKSIARAMGRKYVRISLGGARDEADVRGHRRTYVGAMPGRIIQGMKQAGTKNPVFLLDEVDKLGISFQGDPASALLEVLDPAQNDSFVDHYLGVPFDLSEVLFIATANFIQNIPGPLLDRMEVVEFAGYTEREKSEIARKYLIPRQFSENGVIPDQLTITDEALSEVITSYTRESGVRQLEREIGRLARKVARKIAAQEVERLTIDREMVDDLLGRPKVHPEKMAREDEVGVATGMYYTPTGGDIMFVEASTMRGKGELVLTGQLGDVMKESARAAWTYARSHAAALQIADEMFDRDIHIHVPAGAIPKDGPSAGVTMASAVVSALSGRAVRHDIAMTGEITLRGRVLPIGGVKEKVLGAVRAGLTRIILPKENEPDLEDLPNEVRDRIEVFLVQELGEVLAFTLRGATFREGRLLFGDEKNPRDVLPLSGGFRH
ncbi:MAG TPA: endopeptidase La [Gemmatimonadales bacterium]|jgi:ATP-dependent Lon protease|nr:endopeptidase La [Gemmatimonadales bacterium]